MHRNPICRRSRCRRMRSAAGERVAGAAVGGFLNSLSLVIGHSPLVTSAARAENLLSGSKWQNAPHPKSNSLASCNCCKSPGPTIRVLCLLFLNDLAQKLSSVIYMLDKLSAVLFTILSRPAWPWLRVPYACDRRLWCSVAPPLSEAWPVMAAI